MPQLVIIVTMDLLKPTDPRTTRTTRTTRSDRARQFRERLNEAMQAQWLNRSTLAERAGVDRSTVSLLLSEQQAGLPSGHVVADLAAALNVTTDWLLGLTTTTRAPGEILRESLQVAERPPGRNDANIERWLQEAGDAKVEEFPDLLHPNDAGYARWPEALRPVLARVLAPVWARSVAWGAAAGWVERQPWRCRATRPRKLKLPTR